jgi:nitrogen regulatory protein PII
MGTEAMQTHTKKKIEVIIEAPASRRVQKILDHVGATGYTVVPAASGKGLHGAWDVVPITDARNQMLIIAVVAETLVDQILEEVGRLLVDHPGIVCVSTVEVLRRDRF